MIDEEYSSRREAIRAILLEAPCDLHICSQVVEDEGGLTCPFQMDEGCTRCAVIVIMPEDTIDEIAARIESYGRSS